MAVIGASGAGKSSLLALVAGELPAWEGHVAALPATLLTQRTELFQDTLRGNLLLADPTADDARLWRALADAGLAAHVATLPEGLEARLGEGGAGLSGGQSRRPALARLLLRGAPSGCSTSRPRGWTAPSPLMCWPASPPARWARAC
ncbi:ATP-binding cassette domain-containing protein [Teichococcus aestuarii]|uniref:ATP-binding cassette domain-containing protein n=1 Tax=Teichococcus aestuarii TaxID=568898 RepID=UPI00362348E9